MSDPDSNVPPLPPVRLPPGMLPPPVPTLFAPRERRILLWLTVGAVCWRWVCAVRSPLPGVDACRDLWLAGRVADGDVLPLADAIAQPWWALLLAPAVALGADPFAAAQVFACLLGGLVVWPVAVAAEKLREGAGVCAAVLVLAAGGPAVAAGGGAATALLAFAAAWVAASLVAGRWTIAVVVGLAVAATGVDLAASNQLTSLPPWHFAADLRLGWGIAAALAVLSALPPRPLHLAAIWSLAAAVLALTFAVGASTRTLLVWSPVVAVLAGVGLARIPVRLRDLALCGAVLFEFCTGWQAIEPRAAIVERALGLHLQRRLAPGDRIVSDASRVLLFAARQPIAAPGAAALLAAASEDGVACVVLGPELVRSPTVSATLANRFARLELPHDLADLVDEGNLAVFVRR